MLELGGEPPSLSGVVVDEEGEPLKGVRLWIADPTRFGIIGDDLVTHVEFLTSPDGEESDGYWHSTWTDGKGRFRIGGLFEREYSLRMMERRTLRTITMGPYAARRDDLRITLVAGELRTLAPRVVTASGIPLADVHVALYGATFGGI